MTTSGIHFTSVRRFTFGEIKGFPRTQAAQLRALIKAEGQPDPDEPLRGELLEVAQDGEVTHQLYLWEFGSGALFLANTTTKVGDVVQHGLTLDGADPALGAALVKAWPSAVKLGATQAFRVRAASGKAAASKKTATKPAAASKKTATKPATASKKTATKPAAALPTDLLGLAHAVEDAAQQGLRRGGPAGDAFRALLTRTLKRKPFQCYPRLSRLALTDEVAQALRRGAAALEGDARFYGLPMTKPAQLVAYLEGKSGLVCDTPIVVGKTPTEAWVAIADCAAGLRKKKDIAGPLAGLAPDVRLGLWSAVVKAEAYDLGAAHYDFWERERDPSVPKNRAAYCDRLYDVMADLVVPLAGASTRAVAVLKKLPAETLQANHWEQAATMALLVLARLATASKQPLAPCYATLIDHLVQSAQSGPGWATTSDGRGIYTDSRAPVCIAEIAQSLAPDRRPKARPRSKEWPTGAARITV